MVFIPVDNLELKKATDGIFLSIFVMTVLCFGISPIFKLIKGKCPHRRFEAKFSCRPKSEVKLFLSKCAVFFPQIVPAFSELVPLFFAKDVGYRVYNEK